MTYKTDQMERVFHKLQVQTKPSNHHRSGFIVDDAGCKLFPPVYFSKGNKDIGLDVSNKIRKSLFLKPNDFDALMRCHMSRGEYLKLRKANSST